MDAESSALDTTASETLGPTRTGTRVKQRLLRTNPQDSLPLTLKHERIYILPTARGMAFIGVIAIMLLASINYRLNLGYALCFILIGLFSSTLLSTFKNLVNLKIVAITANDAFQGSPLEYQIEIKNDSRSCKHSVCVSTHQSPSCVDVQAGQSSTACLRINDAQRGVHQLGRLTISSDFPLGIWRGWGYLHTPVTTYVYPKPEHPSPEFSAALTGEQQATNSRTGEQEYNGLKNYEASDSPARIAWKQVASGAGWYSKQFESHDAKSEISISWQDTQAHQNDEQRLSRMSAWLVKAESLRAPFTFELPNSTPSTPMNGSIDTRKCLRELAAYKTHADKK